jgi:hypothetical protein
MGVSAHILEYLIMWLFLTRIASARRIDGDLIYPSEFASLLSRTGGS